MATSSAWQTLAVIPILVGPIQVLLAVLPAIIIALFGVIFSLFRPSVLGMILRLLWRLKLYLVVIILLVAGSIWGMRVLGPGERTAIPAGSCTGAWPLFRGGLDRSGTDVATAGSVGPLLKWSYEKDSNEGFLSSPALVDGRVYVASARMGVYNRSGSIYCFDGETGKVLWSGAPDGYLPTFSSPVISGRFLACGEGLHDTRCARVICLDLSSGKEGNVLWTYETKSHVECTPVICDGYVYVGAGDDGYYCFKLEPDAEGKAQLVWHLSGEDYPDAETSLAVYDGKVYAGLGMNGLALCVIDAKTGKEIQRIETPYPVFSPPAIVNGKLYIGMGNGDYIRSAESIRDMEIERRRDEFDEVELKIVSQELAPGGEVWCVDLETMQVDWSYSVGRTVLGCVAAADDDIYFGSRDKYVYHLDTTGKLKAKRNLHASILTSPAVTRDHVYVVTDAGILYALDREDLGIEWEAVVGTRGVFVSSPAVAGANLYVGTQKNGFVCVGRSREKDTTPVWAGVNGDPAMAGKKQALLPLTGSVRWKVPSNTATAPIMIADDMAYVPMTTADEHGLLIRNADPEGDAVSTESFMVTDNSIHESPARAGNQIMIVDGKRGDTDRNLFVANMSGEVSLEIQVEDGATGFFTVSPTHIYVQNTAGEITCFTSEGRRVWSRTVGQLYSTPCMSGTILILASSNPDTMVALDALTGAELWKHDIPPPETRLFVRGNRIYFGTSKGVASFSLITGAPISDWPFTGTAVRTPLAFMPDAIVCVTRQGELLVQDSVSGNVIRSVRGADPNTGPVVSQGRALYMGMGALITVDLSDEKSEPVAWMDMTGVGQPNTPLVLDQSRVYMGTTKSGPVCLGAPK